MPTHCPSTPRAITWEKQFRKRIFRSGPHPGRERSQADTVFTADPSTLINNFNHIYLPSDPSFLFLTLLMPVLLFSILPAPLSPCAWADSGVQNMHRFRQGALCRCSCIKDADPAHQSCEGTPTPSRPGPVGNLPLHLTCWLRVWNESSWVVIVCN